MPEYREYRKDKPPLLAPGGRYEIVYRPESFLFAFEADHETVRYVVDAKSPKSTVEKVSGEFFGQEVFVTIAVKDAIPMHLAVPAEMYVVPRDDWRAGAEVVLNLAGVDGLVTLDRYRYLGQIERSFDQIAETSRSETDRGLDEPNVRNTVSRAVNDVKRLGAGLGGLALGSLAIFLAAQFFD